MFCLKCQKETPENSVYYIWANKNDLKEWCLSETLCLFEDFTQIASLKSIIEETSSTLKNIIIDEVK